MFDPMKYLYTSESIALCEKYSENVEALRAFLAEVKIKVKPKGIISGFFSPEDSERMILNVAMSRGGKSYTYQFGMSIRDTGLISAGKITQEYKRMRESVLYDVLCSLAIDANSPGDFISWCSEYGYNDDSIKDRATYDKCCTFYHGIHSVLTGLDLSGLPS